VAFEQIVQLFVQGGALAVLAMVLLYAMKVALPSMVNAINSSVDSLIKSNTTVQIALTEQQRILAKLTAVMLLHDATVRGTNPDVMGTTEDIMKRILED
jgi:hypothetical protein